MSIDELLSILNVSEPIKGNKPISDIRKENSNTDKIPKNTRKLFRVEKDKDIKDRGLGDIRNLFRLEKKKDIHDELLGNIRTTFRMKKNIKNIKDRVLRDIKTLCGSDEEDYYKPIRTSNSFSSN